MAARQSKVAFTMDNAKKCICGKCPVQANSKCVKNLQAKLMETLKNPKATPKPKEMPGFLLFCR